MRRLALILGLVSLLMALGACKEPRTSTAAVQADTGQARSLLGTLKVETPHPQGKYDRAQFKHWIPQGGGCDTRAVVLKREGTDVRVDKGCKVVSGHWPGRYDDKTWSKVSDLDIDHMVPLGEAWKSGAWAWSPRQRQDFANDLTDPQLHAVTDNLNQEKGDKTPDQWKPPLTAYWPTYATEWITVKAKFKLTITAPEKKALELMLR
jgi:hypothetical protein